MSIEVFVGGKKICDAVSMEVEVEREEMDVPDFKRPFTVEYEGTLTMTRGTIETPKEDDRISSNVLSRYFKGIALDWGVYKKISRSLDKLGRVKNGE